METKERSKRVQQSPGHPDFPRVSHDLRPLDLKSYHYLFCMRLRHIIYVVFFLQFSPYNPYVHTALWSSVLSCVSL